MSAFMIRFALCNVGICGIIGLFLLIKRLLKRTLSSRMQYHLWYLLLGLLAVPFLPVRLPGIFDMLSWISRLKIPSASGIENAVENTGVVGLAETSSDWMNDFTLSVNSETPALAGYLLLIIWLCGILVMLALTVRAFLCLRALEKSALPLQSPNVRRLYRRCLEDTGIRKNIPIYSTAFLKSPMITGIFYPRIYLPIHLISYDNETAIRYMLLHELQHYRHKDTTIGFLMNLTGIVYWFHPFVRYALREMRSDSEVACDAAVLHMLDQDAYEDYGNTLINFAEKVSGTPFPFVTSYADSRKQLERRILHISSYQNPTRTKTCWGVAVFFLTAAFLIGFAPVLSTCASENQTYSWDTAKKDISAIDVSEQFGTYTGSFVLYDLKNDRWFIHDREQALVRTSPDSTYKIYDALFALDAGIISPENSQLAWDHTIYPFEPWNADQTLSSAMSSSVNWYFQSLDRQLGKTSLSSYMKTIGYGNKNTGGDLSSYWMESTLKISPVEQAELLIALYQNVLPFAPEHMQAVKEAICLSSSDRGTLYGKTGTGRVDGQDVNGWFVGYLETPDNTWFFAANIQGKQAADGRNGTKTDSGATGSAAAEMTLAILDDLGIAF